MTMIPIFLIWNKLGLTGTQVPLWAQNLFGSAFYIFLGVPRELFETAAWTAAASSPSSGGWLSRWPGRR